MLELREIDDPIGQPHTIDRDDLAATYGGSVLGWLDDNVNVPVWTGVVLGVVSWSRRRRILEALGKAAKQ